MTDFWRRWLRLWCLFAGLFWPVLAGATFDSTDAPMEVMFSIVSGWDFEWADHLRFAFDLQGALSLGLAYPYCMLLQASVRHGFDELVWKMAFGALLVWFLLNGITSLATGYELNVLSNTIILVLFVLPLWMIYCWQETEIFDLDQGGPPWIS